MNYDYPGTHTHLCLRRLGQRVAIATGCGLLPLLQLLLLLICHGGQGISIRLRQAGFGCCCLLLRLGAWLVGQRRCIATLDLRLALRCLLLL
jgi:hypothetical protein